ncbi:TIGR02221 family CRISPR-associated protein [Prevotella denticola]|uniref:TIGR02221 family CRISPR-associated protein n=1 Tax=Prevotella denticola TaxID=28129 RepID=UPI0002013567|nr:TIGR02221 family CRISPR-associated protein [Prevotella denticola]AEA21028.1 CRISPR-associated protein, TM1812 family [Prevotella denticola F0289]QUB89073.1 TIGR02221 family CRISPR-associated protein [Prevotella denticola]
MARKLFISVLGTGLYEKGVYTQGPFRSSETRFIQQATLELIGCKETWTENDEICILLTEKAQELNWNATSRKRPHSDDMIPYKGLNTLLQQMELLPKIHPVPILNGKDENEMWKIFQTIFSQIQEGDELYFDLTHSFRYLPMLVLVLGNYAKFLKNVHIAHISYGNYEARNEKGSPIVDLLPLTVLQDWTFAAADFLRNGHSEHLVHLTTQVYGPILSETQGRDEQAKNLKTFSKLLQTITNNLQMCRGLSITQDRDISDLRHIIGELSEDIIKPLIPVVDKIEQSFSDFADEADITNGLCAAKWCYDNQMYQQAITILQETVVTYICQLSGLSITDKNARSLVNAAFHIVANRKQQAEDSWKLPPFGKEDEALNEVRKLISLPLVTELSSSFMVATDIRNDFNHAGFRNNPMKAEGIISKIGERIEKVNGIVLSGNSHQTARPVFTFLNLSNHPLSTWSSAQLAAAKEYGGLEEMPFPDISPELSAGDVQAMATAYVDDILKHYPARGLTVHVMGEMTFCYHVARQLKEAGVCCVASTSERIVEELDGDRKLAQFSFVRFREY